MTRISIALPSALGPLQAVTSGESLIVAKWCLTRIFNAAKCTKTVVVCYSFTAPRVQ
ncbi:hypothetical protein M758_2G035600 [Ceratodon purpureus]|uniref:Uncharacterized protein n=1 Tax=Ceratodon purpureus TaxID=3225 RepID=A0A8T0IRU8_CERPU|nr:hypothetical protein KC19_2G036900 [Ceratodon purpureus]KAG0625199.1 hypothetical protein M758_2G035600 [Ceratodon purpureus]